MTLRHSGPRASLLAGLVAATALSLVSPLAPPAQAADLGAPSGLAAANKNTSTPILSWNKVKKATAYQVQVDNDPGFGSPEFSVTTVNSRAVPTANLRPGENHWRVRATASGTNSAWSSGNLSISPVGVPVPTAPGNGASLPQPQSAPLLRWQGVQGATSYSVEVDGDSDFIGAKTYTTKTTSLVVADPLTIGDWYWRVTAVKSAGIVSTPSETYRFDIEPLATPTLVYPPNDPNIDVEDVVFDWQPVPGARTYDLQVALDPGFNNFALDVKNIQGSRYSPPTTLNSDEFYWRVRAVDLAGQQTPWAQSNFVFERVWHDQPQPVFPLGSSASPAAIPQDNPYYQWTPVQHATRYELIVSHDANFSPAQIKTCVVTGTTYTPTSLNDPCAFEQGVPLWWKVVPIDLPYPSGLPGQDASVAQGFVWEGPTALGTFSGTHQTVTGLKIAMTGAGIDDPLKGCTAVSCANAPATPVLSWDHQPGIGAYMIYIAQDGNFTTTEVPAIPVVQRNTKFALDLSNSVSTLPESEVGSSYHWYVRPCTTAALSNCGPDPASASLPGAHIFSKKSPPVTGLASSNPAGSDITFDWQDYHTTNVNYPQWFGEGGQQTARTYHIQVDTDPAFSGGLVDEATVDQATYTAANKLYPEGTLYWRVQAIDDESFGLAWSAVQSFTKSSPAVQLTGPGNGAAVAGTTPFTWNAQAYASSYTIEVYRNNDAAFSPGNRVFSANVKTAAYAWNQPLPADPTPYIWRVRKTDASGNVGPWSAAGRFTSLGSVPQLLTPGNSTWQPTAGPLFEWTEVAGAASYQLDVRVAGATSSYLNVSTVATAHAPVKAIATNDYTWRVTALDAAGKSLGTSAARSFRVDATPPTIKKVKPATNKLKPKSLVIVVFSEKVQGVSKKSLYITPKGKKKAMKAKVTLNKKKTKATVDVKPRFKPGTYTLHATTKIKDLRGNPLAGGEAVTIAP